MYYFHSGILWSVGLHDSVILEGTMNFAYITYITSWILLKPISLWCIDDLRVRSSLKIVPDIPKAVGFSKGNENLCQFMFKSSKNYHKQHSKKRFENI